MIYAFDTDDRTLTVFANEAAACSYAEGVDVEDGLWSFFAADGAPLDAVFTTPNKRGRFWVESGTYRLRPHTGGLKPGLSAILHEVAAVDGELRSIEDVRARLNRS